MDIIIVGAGKVGYAVAQQLSREAHNVTVVDRSPERVNLVNGSLNVGAVCAEGGIESLKLAGVGKADLLIAVTSSDEVNILCCMVARKLGVGGAIARVRNAERFREVVLLQNELGLSMTINPEHAAAREISRVLRFPSAAKVEPFAKGQAELVEFLVSAKNPLCGVRLRELHGRFGRGVLICAVHRRERVLIPDADFLIEEGDAVSVVGAPKEVNAFFKAMDIFQRSARHVVVVGGGHIGKYLAEQLLSMGIRVKIIERSPEKCELCKDELPRAEIVQGDGSQPDLLREEGLDEADAFVALTGSDEINLIAAAYARSTGVPKVVAKVNQPHLIPLAESFGLDEPVQPSSIAAQLILRTVRGMANSAGAGGVETLRRLADGSLEALEFRVLDSFPGLNVPLKDLAIRPGVLLTAVIREGRCFIPGGSDFLCSGDSVIAVTSRAGVTRLEDILRA